MPFRRRHANTLVEGELSYDASRTNIEVLIGKDRRLEPRQRLAIEVMTSPDPLPALSAAFEGGRRLPD